MDGKGASRVKAPGNPARAYLAMVSPQISPVRGCLARKRLNNISFLQRRWAPGSQQRLVATMKVMELEVCPLWGAMQAAMAVASWASK